MKECPKCGIVYPDSENYCMECGKELKPKEFATVKPEEFVSLASQVAELSNELNDVKEALASIKHQELPEDITEIPKHTKAIKEMSKEFVSLASQVGKLETGLEDLKDRIETIRHPELPEDITAISKHTKELKRLKEFAKQSRSALKGLEKGINRNAKLMVGIENKFTDFKNKISNLVENIENREESRLSGIEQELDTLRKAQEKLEIDKLRGTAAGTEAKVSQLESKAEELGRELGMLKNTVNALAKSLERMEAARPSVDIEGIKKSVTRDILNELKRMVS